MSAMRILLCLCLTVASTPTAAQEPLRPGDVVVRGGWLFDAVSDAARRNSGIVIRNGTLLEVDARLGGRDLGAARVIDLGADEYVLPGLFDLHAHYAVDLFGEGRVDEWTVNPIVFLANGVTSTFPAGEMQPDSMRAARLRIDAGLQPGPRIHNSGPYFGSARPGWDHDAISADSVRREVDYWIALGAKGFKAKGIRPLHLDALIGQAHRHGVTVTGHLDSGFRESVNPREAILMGIDRVEHFLGGDAIAGDRPAYSSLERLDASAPEVKSIISLYLAHRVNFDATLTAYGYFGEREPVVYEYWHDEMGLLTPYARAAVDARLPRRANAQFERIYHVKRSTVKAFYDAGGGDLLTLGTDHPSWGEFFSGFGAHRELHAFVLAGIPPAAAIRIGTINGARALGVDAQLGTIEAGKLADLFVVRGNPLEDITNTRNARLIVRAGMVYDPAELLASVAGRLGPAGEADASWWKGNLRANER